MRFSNGSETSEVDVGGYSWINAASASMTAVPVPIPWCKYVNRGFQHPLRGTRDSQSDVVGLLLVLDPFFHAGPEA